MTNHTTDTQRGADGAIDRLRTEATGPLGFDPDSPMARDILTLIARLEAAERVVEAVRHIGKREPWLTDKGYAFLVSAEDRHIQSLVIAYDAATTHPAEASSPASEEDAL